MPACPAARWPSCAASSAEEIAANRTELDALSAQVVEAGLATWTGEGRAGSLIVRGQARLLSDVTQIERLAAIQSLFERLEAQETMLRLLELAEQSRRRADLHRRRERAVRHLRGLDGGGRRQQTPTGTKYRSRIASAAEPYQRTASAMFVGQ